MNSLKRRTSIVFMFVLILAIPMAFASAAAAELVYINDASVNPGDSITVPILINVTDSTGLSAATIELHYNSSVVNVTAVSDSDFDMIVSNIQNPSGSTRIVTSQLSSSGVGPGIIQFANVTLQSVGAAGDFSPLNLSIETLKNNTGQPMSYSISNGTFTIDTTIPTTGHVHNINKGTNYTTIQAAINDADPGDGIHVDSGTYSENVNVNKRITLQGEGADVVTVTAALTSDHVFEVTADYVNISGFKVTGATANSKAGIYLGSGVAHGNIFDNNASNNYHGIYLYSSSNNNNLTHNIANLNINIGIYLSSSSTNNNLMHNTANSNHAGIHLSSSSDNNLTHNTANSNAGAGIYLYSSNANNLTSNTANLNTNFGIYLHSSSTNNTLTSNTANLNTDGIYLLSSSNTNNLTGNTANLNTNFGIHLLSSNNNTIYNNYFNNTNNAFDNGNNRWNTTKMSGTNIIGGPYIGGNVWARPDGTGFSQICSNMNGDGICDSPYVLDANNTDYLPLTYNNASTIPTSPENLLCAGMCHSIYRRVNSDYVANTSMNFSIQSTTLGILKDGVAMTPWVVQNPVIDFYYNTSEVLIPHTRGTGLFDNFSINRTFAMPNNETPGHLQWNLTDLVSLYNITTASDLVDPPVVDYPGMNITRQSDYLITTNRTYWTIISVDVIEDSFRVAISLDLTNNTTLATNIINYTTTPASGSVVMSNKTITALFDGMLNSTNGTIDLTVFYNVTKYDPANFIYKPDVKVSRRELEYSERANGTYYLNVDNVSYTSRISDMNATFSSSALQNWSTEEFSIKVIQLSENLSLASLTIPELDTSYWGNVTIDNLPVGAMVSVENNGSEIANTTSNASGLYQINVPWGDSGVSAGDTITFKVNGVTAESRIVDNQGTNNKLDLNIASDDGSNTSRVNISDAQASFEGTTTSPIYIDVKDPSGLGAVTIDLTFNASVVNVISVENTDFDMLVPNINNSTGIVTMVAAQTGGAGIGPGVIKFADVTLMAVGNRSESSPLNLEVVTIKNNTGQPMPYSISNGTFTIFDSAAPSLITYTISNSSIIPPQTTSIDVGFSERVRARITIEDQDRNLVKQLYYSNGVTNPSPKTWDGTYTNDTQVPDGSYYVNVTGESTTTGLSVVNNSETIIVESTGTVTLVSIAVTGNATVVNGSTATYTATATYSDNSTAVITAAWTSSNETVATINAATGVLTALTAGTTTVTATSGSVSGTAIVTVNLIIGIRGDVNGDDAVNVGDITYLARYLAEWPGYAITTENADVNGDDAVNVGDITYLARYLAEWPGYEI